MVLKMVLHAGSRRTVKTLTFYDTYSVVFPKCPG